jgi:chromosome segregation ATPase
MSLPICTTHLVDAVGACPKCAEDAVESARLRGDASLLEKMPLLADQIRRIDAECERLREANAKQVLVRIELEGEVIDLRERAEAAERALAEARAALRTFSGRIDVLQTRASEAERALDRVMSLGHNNDCLFCGFKDRVVAEARAARAHAEGRHE